MKITPYFAHRPPSKTTLLHDPVPGIAVYLQSRTTKRKFWRRFLAVRKKSPSLAKKNFPGLSS